MSEQQPPCDRAQPPEESKGEQRETDRESEPKIYVADLAAYNNGQLHGAWLNAGREPEALLAGISEMLARSPIPGSEEWAIHDYEGFGPIQLREYEDLDLVSRYAKGIVEHGPAFAAFGALAGDELLDDFECCYRGQWASLTAYAEDFLADIGLEEMLENAVPQSLFPYVKVDAEALGRDLEISGDVLVADDGEGGVFLFSPE